MRYAQLFDGTRLSFPDDTPDEVINRVAREETLKRNAPPVQAPIAPSTERTAGEAVTDIGAALVSGTGRMLAFPGQAVALVPGLRGLGSAIASPGEAIAEFGEGLKSQGLKVREALRSQAISEAEKDGILSEFGTAIKETLKDPALISTFLTEQVPNFLPPMLIGRLAAKIGVSTAQGLTGEAAEQAVAQAQRRGVTAAVGTGAAMQSADISSEAYKQAYEAAIAQGKPPEQAESEANNAARIAAGGAFGISLATQKLPGARAIEQRLVGAPGGVSRVVGGFGEATAESLDEAGGALFQNIGIRTVDPNQSLTQGVGAAAGLGLLGGGFFGTLLSKKATPEPLPGQLPGETIEQSILRLVAERESLKTPPVPESIIPDVDVIKLAGSLDEKGNPIGYALLTQYEERLKQLPESPERDQALQVASSVKERLNIESIQRQQNAYQNIITYKDMKDLGLNESDPLYESLVGKNLGAPDDATKVIETLNKELEQDIPSQRRELVGVMLEQVQGFLDQVPGSAFYAPRTDQRADGAGASVSDQLGAGTPGGPQTPSDASLDASTGLPGKRDEGEAEQPRPLRFETELGSTYEVNDAGETIRTKRSPGKGQGTTYPPHSVLYVSPENIIKILDDRFGGNPVRLGYRKDYETGAMFAPVSDRSQIPEGAQPLVAVVSKTNNELVGVYPAQVSPEVGLHPVEKRYEGGQSFTHLGNKIVRLLTDKDIVTPKMLEGLGIKKQSAVAKRILGKEVTSAEVKAELAKRKQSLRTEEAQEQPQETPQEVPQEVSPPETPKERIDAINKQLEGLMKRLLSKYGLKDVSVQIVKDMAAKGEFSGRLIKLADDTDNPLVDLRHEAIHALKELGFFTPAQWETLKNKAAQEWVQTYLKDAPYTDKVSRYEAYKQMFEAEGKNPQEVEEALIEEAIADAFSYFNKTRPPAGLMASINFRLKNLFKAFKTFLDESSLSAEDIFGRIDEGKLPSKAEAKAAEPPKASLRDTPKIDRQRSLNDKRISPRFPTAVKATEDVLAAIRLQPDLATFKRDPDAFRYNIGLMSKYPNFTDIKGTPNQRAEQIINRLKDNLLWLYNSWDTNLRDRSKLWYVGGNRIAHRWAQKYGIPPETAAAIIASLSPQKDWFQNVSLAERTLDAIVFNADFRWDAAMDRVFKERAWTKKFPVKQYRGKTLKEMYVPGDPKSLAKMAVWIRAWDEGHNPQTARVITPEGTFTNEIASGKTGAPIAMRAQSFAAMVKTLQIMQDSNLENFSNLIGKNHKVRSFYNNIIAPFAGDDVTIDTHAVAAALMRPLGSSDLEVYHNFGSAKPAKKDKEGNILVKAGKGTKNSAVTGLYGTYAIYAEAYRRAAQEVGVFPREMQSITWEAIRGLFRPEQKQARLKSQVDALWNKVAKGEINAEDARQQISKLVSGIEDPAWVKSPAGSNESRTDSSYATELPGDRVPGRGSEQLPGGAGERAAGVRATTGIIESGRLPKQSIRQGEQDARPTEPAVRPSGRGDERGAEVQPERTGDGRGRDQGRSLAPLEGAPNVQGATGPDPRLVEVAERYAESKGIPYKRQARYVEVDEDRSRRIAEAYADMPHAPQDPVVKEAYADLIRQTKDQYQALVDAGYQFTFFDEDTDPYDGNPFNAMRDLRQNKRMAVYGTYDGYGTEGITGAAVEDNPMLEDTGLRWPDQNGVEHMVTANDLFRAVHDAFGHGLEGAGFRAKGEENAWQAHARLFTGPAVGAITSETRGQNSWLNFGPYGETNRTAKLEDTVFAEQKTGLMPEWTWTEGIAPDSRDVRYSLREDTRSPALILGTKQPNASEYFGVHYGNTRTDKLSGSKYGTGIRGAERRRLDQSFDDRIRKRVYFYVAKPDGSMPPPETGLGPYVYTQNMGNILGPGPEMQRINNQVNGESNEFESAVIDAGYDGYAVPSMGMMVVLNHDVPVNYEGTREEYNQNKIKRSLRNSIFEKQLNKIDIKSVDDFWRVWQNFMIGTAATRGTASSILDTESRENRIKQAVSVWKKDVQQYGIKRYLMRYEDNQGKDLQLDDVVKSSVARGIFTSAGIKPTLKNILFAYNSLPGQVIAANDVEEIIAAPEYLGSLVMGFDRKPKSVEPEAINDIKFSLRSPDTKAFKQWFGDSKVVDENGDPLVMYHGTTKDFSVFKTKNGAVFVTPSRSFANKIAMDDMLFTDSDVPIGPSGANVMPVYVRAERPFDFENASDIKAVQKLLDDPVDKKRFAVGAKSGKWQDIEDFLGSIEDAGFDGAYISEQGIKNLAVFSPTQIKSAIGNIGTFDPANPDIRYSLRTPKQNIRSQIPQNILTRVDATIAFREDKTVARRMMDAISPRGFSWFREQAINRYEYLSKIDRKYVNRMGGVRLLADQSAEAAALFSDLGAGITASAFGVHDRVGGIPVYRNGVVQVSNQNNTIKGPLAVFAPLGKYGDPEVYRLYEFWATVKRGARLNAQGKLTPFTPADIAHAQALQARFPEFVTIQREWIKYNDGLVKFMQDTGVITPQAAQEFKQHGDYFPMYKYFEGDEVTGPKVFSSIANVAAPKKYKGDDQPLGDFFENVVRNTQAAIQAGIKNIAAQRATQVAVSVGEVTPLNSRPTKMTPEVYRVLENGVEKYYAANDMMMISALKSLNIPDLPLIGVFAGPANLLRNLITKTPDFMMANMLRDSLSAWVTSGKNITPVISTMINFSKAIAEKSPELNALRNAGILGGYDYAQGVESTAQTFAKDLRKISNSRTTMEKITSPVTSLWGALEKASSASDAATRMEVYKKTLAETGNEAEALFQALEIMNFNRKGRSPVIRALTAAVPFLNARIQGLDVLYRSGIRPLFAGDATAQERARAKTFFLRGATIMALSAMYWMMTHDDEEYKVQEQETRDNYWLLPSLGVKIPIPFEIGVIFKVIPERVLEYSFGDDTGKDFVNAMSRQLLNTFSFNPIPQTVLPVVEAATNYSFFTTRPILGQGMEGIAPEFQATPTTSKTATSITDAYNSVIDLMPDAVAKKLRASPVILEHLIQGYTGTMGMYAMQTMDYIISANSDVPNASKRFEQMPVIRRFAVDPQARGTVTAFYDMKNAVDSVTRTASYLERTMNFEDQAEFIRDNIKTLAVKEYVQSLEKTMKEFRDQKLVIRSSTMSADAKRSYLDTIEKMELQLTANIRTLQKQMSSS